MKNSKLRRVLLLLASAVLLVSLSVGATLAYLTSTDSVKNTFTVGQVGLTLDEAAVDKYGDQLYDVNGEELPRRESNAYHLMPGFEYIKDPTIHIDADSELCWVWAKIVVSEMEGGDIDALRERLNYGVDKLIGLDKLVNGGVFDKTYVQGEDLGVWIENAEPATVCLKQKAEGDTNVFYVYYLQPQTKGTNLVLFEELTVPHEWDNDEIINLNKIQMDITAYAIQADGFDNVYDAEEAFAINTTAEYEKFDESIVYSEKE